jgi:hypothetical protein
MVVVIAHTFEKPFPVSFLLWSFIDEIVELVFIGLQGSVFVCLVIFGSTGRHTALGRLGH